MAKRLTTENQLALLRELRTGEKSPEAIARLETLLRSTRLHGLTLKGAADLAARWEARELTDALRAAAESLAPDSEGIGAEANKRDPGCEGKEAALRALIDWEADFPALYQRASRWTQRVPIMNGSKDTAGECRGLAAIGLAFTHAGGDQGITRLIDLLVDEEPATRARAAQALALWRSLGTEGASVLRLKAHLGDDNADVLGEVFAGILRSTTREDSQEALTFVAGFLDQEDEKITEAAAVALGQSRDPRALQPLASAWQRNSRHPIRTSILMAIALLRQEESINWLLEQLTQSRGNTTVEILDALKIFQGDEKITKRIKTTAEKSREGAAAFRELFT